jgi:hypothetical protein
MYEVYLSHEAEKYYKKQDRDSKRRINKCIDNLGREPVFGPHIKRLGAPCIFFSPMIFNLSFEIKRISGCTTFALSKYTSKGA